jgi:hypothetical protein
MGRRAISGRDVGPRRLRHPQDGHISRQSVTACTSRQVWLFRSRASHDPAWDGRTRINNHVYYQIHTYRGCRGNRLIYLAEDQAWEGSKRLVRAQKPKAPPLSPKGIPQHFLLAHTYPSDDLCRLPSIAPGGPFYTGQRSLSRVRPFDSLCSPPWPSRVKHACGASNCLNSRQHFEAIRQSLTTPLRVLNSCCKRKAGKRVRSPPNPPQAVSPQQT